MSVTASGSFDAQSVVIDGTLAVPTGDYLALDGALAGTGAIDIGAGADLLVENYADETAAASGLTIDFAGSGGALTLDSSVVSNGAFAPSLFGLAVGDTIDLTSFSDDDSNGIASAGITQGNGGGTITITETDGATFTLNYAGNLSGEIFALSPDGEGGTDLVLEAGDGWTNASGGDWTTGSNWSDGVPGPTTNAYLDLAC